MSTILYSPIICSQSHILIQLMPNSLLSIDDIIYKCASNHKELKIYTASFYSRGLWQQTHGDLKGEQKHSKVYDTAIKTKSNVFAFLS